jgi:hypothetical protein
MATVDPMRRMRARALVLEVLDTMRIDQIKSAPTVPAHERDERAAVVDALAEAMGVLAEAWVRR